MKNLNTYTVATLAGLVFTSLIAGCEQGPIAHGENFYSDSAVTCVGTISQAQSATGAKDDATLYDKNFHGGELNSLGQVKLDLIVKGTPAGDPVYVYLNMPHDQVAERQGAVTDYLKSAGVVDTKIIVAEGSNPNPGTPTAYNLGGLYKSDGTSYNGQAAPDADSGAGAAMGGAH